MTTAVLSFLLVSQTPIPANVPIEGVRQRSAYYLTEPETMEKLKLSAATRGRIHTIVREFVDRQVKLSSAKVLDEKALETLDRETARRLLSALTPEQRMIVYRMGLEREGVEALLAVDVRKELKLTALQVDKIGNMFESASEASFKLESIILDRIEKADPESHAAIQKEYEAERARLSKQRAEEMRKALQVLTVAQRKTWAALTGK